jgi:hypothetical protein
MESLIVDMSFLQGSDSKNRRMLYAKGVVKHTAADTWKE